MVQPGPSPCIATMTQLSCTHGHADMNIHIEGMGKEKGYSLGPCSYRGAGGSPSQSSPTRLPYLRYAWCRGADRHDCRSVVTIRTGHGPVEVGGGRGAGEPEGTLGPRNDLAGRGGHTGRHEGGRSKSSHFDCNIYFIYGKDEG